VHFTTFWHHHRIMIHFWPPAVVLVLVLVLVDTGNCQILMAIDGLNVCWGGSRSRRIDDRNQFYEANNFSFIHHYRRMLQPDWTGGATVCSSSTGCCSWSSSSSGCSSSSSSGSVGGGGGGGGGGSSSSSRHIDITTDLCYNMTGPEVSK